MGRLSVAEQKERDEYILELIKTSGESGVSSRVIADDCGMSDASAYMKRFITRHPEIHTRPRKNQSEPTIYFWEDPPKQERETHSPFLKNRYEKTGKNHEGYTDPTATKAIAKVLFKSAEIGKKEMGDIMQDLIMPVAGEVWVVNESNGTTGYIYVLAFEEGAAQCIRLYKMNDCDNAEGINRNVRIKIGSETYIGDASRITFKPKKYLLRRALKRDDTILPGVRKAVASVLGILSFRTDVEPTVIEKEVIKEVPGPERIVEKIVYKDREPAPVPDGYISKTEAELQNLKQQVEIWRSAFWGVVKRDRADAAKTS